MWISNVLTSGSHVANRKSGLDYSVLITIYIYIYIFNFTCPVRCFHVPSGGKRTPGRSVTGVAIPYNKLEPL
jgi:hypothetical protein